MGSEIYIRNVFDVIGADTLRDYVHDYANNHEKLSKIFDVMPQRATEFSAGYDIGVLNDYVIPPHSSEVVAFGDSINIKNPHCIGVVAPRSSLAKKRGLVMVDGPKFNYAGTGFPDIYSCEFYNFTDNEVHLTAGERIAQILFIRYPEWVVDDVLELIDKSPLDESIMSPRHNNNLEFINPFFTKKLNQNVSKKFNFQSPKDYVLMPGVVNCIMTGIKCKLEHDQVYLLKSAFPNPAVQMANCIGVIDSDYYGNKSNDGEIGVLLLNLGVEPVNVHTGDVIASGAIYFYEKVEGDSYGGKRVGGFGSTDG